MVLIHVPPGENARLRAERTDQFCFTFQIHNGGSSFVGKTELSFRDLHDHSNPFLTSPVTEHLKIGILREQMLSIDIQRFGYVVFQFRAIHRHRSLKKFLRHAQRRSCYILQYTMQSRGFQSGRILHRTASSEANSHAKPTDG